MAPIWKLTVAPVIALATTANAHMNLFYPPPLGGENNPHRTDPPEPRIDYPYNCCGEKITPFPCRGYLKLLGTDQGRPVVTWEAGSVQHFSLVGKGTHWGGSCQVGFSVDEGETWQVVRSYEGACPLREFGAQDPEGQSFDFTVPADIPPGDQIFAWTWINREGEFFMNCAAVTIVGGADGVPSPDGNVTNPESASPESSQPVSQPILQPSSQSPSQPPSQPASQPASTAYQTPPPESLDFRVPGFTYIRPEPQEPNPTDGPSVNPSRTPQTVPSDTATIISIPPDVLSTINSQNPRPSAKSNACIPRSMSNPPKARIPMNRRRAAINLDTIPRKTQAKRAPEIPYHDRPGFLIANLGNGCEAVRSSSEVKYPNPGPDVAEGDGVYPLELPGPAEKCGL